MERGNQRDVLALGWAHTAALPAPFGVWVDGAGGPSLLQGEGAFPGIPVPKGQVQLVLLFQLLTLEPWKCWLSLQGARSTLSLPRDAPAAPVPLPGDV